MDLDPLLLDDNDYVYAGIERLRFVCCRTCMRYTPFLFFLPANETSDNPLRFWNDYLVLCANCLPNAESLRGMYPTIDNSAACSERLVEALKGFEYSNPYYRKYANVPRVLITVDTPASLHPATETLEELVKLFPEVHLLEYKRYYGLEEIGKVISLKSKQIREYYSARPVESPRSDGVQSEPTTPGSFVENPEGYVEHNECTTPIKEVFSAGHSCPLDLTLRSRPYVALESRFKLNVLSSSSKFPCDICLLTEKDSIAYGEFIQKQQMKRTLRCHYFCLLSGTSIIQNGLDISGILGFLLKDVYDSFKFYRTSICSYCDQPSAAIKCDKVGCSRQFHYICGYKNGCVTQFCGSYPSFCHEHHPEQNKPTHGATDKCWICWESLGEQNGPSVVYSTCEPEHQEGPSETAWYHRYCLQRYAFEAGYYFKCPNCFDKDFIAHAQLQGVFVPTRDATWELERGAYKEIHNSKCTAAGSCRLATCSGSSRQSDLVGCKACGGETRHLVCASVDDPDDYVCSNCMDATFIKLF